MEFGIFQNGYIPGPSAHIPEHEHLMLMREASYPIHADKHNWKFAWFGEHHCLTEYSHMSAPEVLIGWIAAQTNYIHLGTAITSLPTTKEHPVRIAERAAMLDHFCEGRFEFGTGRGAGSHEVAAFNGTLTSETKAMWNEAITEIPRMWAQRDYSYEGEHFRVPPNHNILPKPLNGTHPPLWVACGNLATFATAGQMGIGAIAFNFEPAPALKGRIDSYKEAIAECAEPHGSYMNDNVMMTNALICLEDRDRAREIALMHGRGYLYSMVCLYHDTIPKREGSPTWPEPPLGLPDEATLDFAIGAGYMLCGTPEEVCEQLEKSYVAVGTDQLVFGLPNEGFEYEEILEMIEVFGDQVIPEFDKDRVHSTEKYRANAVRKHAEWNAPPPDIKTTPPPSASMPIPYRR